MHTNYFELYTTNYQEYELFDISFLLGVLHNHTMYSIAAVLICSGISILCNHLVGTDPCDIIIHMYLLIVSILLFAYKGVCFALISDDTIHLPYFFILPSTFSFQI